MANGDHSNGNGSVTWRWVAVTVVGALLLMIGGSWASINQRQSRIEETLSAIEEDIGTLKANQQTGDQRDNYILGEQTRIRSDSQREDTRLQDQIKRIQELLDRLFPRRTPFSSD